MRNSLKYALKLVFLKCIFEFMINTAPPASNSVYGREKLFWYDKINYSNHMCHCGGAIVKEFLARADKPLAMDWIIFLSLSNQILEAWLWLARIENKDDVMKPINSHSRRRTNSKSQHCIQFYARLDRLIVYSMLSRHENFNLLFSVLF